MCKKHIAENSFVLQKYKTLHCLKYVTLKIFIIFTSCVYITPLFAHICAPGLIVRLIPKSRIIHVPNRYGNAEEMIHRDKQILCVSETQFILVHLYPLLELLYYLGPRTTHIFHHLFLFFQLQYSHFVLRDNRFVFMKKHKRNRKKKNLRKISTDSLTLQFSYILFAQKCTHINYTTARPTKSYRRYRLTRLMPSVHESLFAHVTLSRARTQHRYLKSFNFCRQFAILQRSIDRKKK